MCRQMNRKRNHLAVIMARGSSRRMGVPKGLCSLPSGGLPFVARISRLYLDLGFPVLLLVRHEDELSYRECLAEFPVEILSVPGGGDTAQTMGLALDWARDRKLGDVCFWAHPVDLPLVRSQTIGQLLAAYEQNDGNALRPWFEDTPGHPVLFPGGALARVLAGNTASLTMNAAWNSAVLKAMAPPVGKYATEDKGTVTDFDRPENLSGFRPKKEPE